MSVKLTEDDYHVDQFNKGWAGSVLSEEDIKACTKKPNFSKPLDSFIAGRRKKDKDQLLQLEQSTISQMMVCMKKKYTNRDYDKLAKELSEIKNNLLVEHNIDHRFGTHY